jgi:hypothetical protein
MTAERLGNALHDLSAPPTWFVRTLLVVLPLLLYGRSLSYGLLGLDDQGYYYSEATAGGTWRGLATLWTTTAMSDYAPVAQLTMWLDRAIAGEQWWFARLHQILWFAFGAWGVHALALRITAGRGVAFAVALLFVLHPVCGESVLWLAERKNLVAFALSMWCVERYVAAVRDCAGWPAVLAAWVLGALALLAKPHAVCLPLLLAAYELALGSGALRPRLLRVALPALLVAAYVVIQLHVLRSDLDRQFLAGSRAAAVLVDGQILCRYLAMALLPQHLTIYYAAPESVHPLTAGLAWMGLLALVALSLRPPASRALVAWAWLSAGAALSPALNLVPQLAPLADHYLLWALPELLLLAAVLVRELAVRLPPSAQARAPRLVVAGMAAFFTLLSLARVPEFAGKESFFSAAVRHQPEAGIGWALLCQTLIEKGGDPAPARRAAVHALACEDSGRILSENRAMVIVLAALELHDHGDRPGMDALVEREVARLPEDGQLVADVVRAQVALRIGEPARAVALLQRFYGPPMQEAAAALRTRCRAGDELPDGQPPLVGVFTVKGRMDDSIDRGHMMDNQVRQLQSLAYAYLLNGDLEHAFDVAALALNLAPQSAEARQLLITIDRRLHLDAAAERLAGGATGAVPSPSPSR